MEGAAAAADGAAACAEGEAGAMSCAGAGESSFEHAVPMTSAATTRKAFFIGELP